MSIFLNFSQGGTESSAGCDQEFEKALCRLSALCSVPPNQIFTVNSDSVKFNLTLCVETIYKKNSELAERERSLKSREELLPQLQDIKRREALVENSKQSLEKRYQTLDKKEQRFSAKEKELEEKELQLRAEEKTLAAQKDEWNHALQDWQKKVTEQRVELDTLKAQAEEARRHRDEADTHIADLKKQEAQIAAKEQLLRSQEAALSRKGEFAQSRADALAHLADAHTQIVELLAQTKQIGKQVSQEQRMLEAGFIASGLRSIIHLIRSLRHLNTSDAAEAARELEFILQQDFGCVPITPAPGEAFDSLIMAMQDYSVLGDQVGSVVACGWKLNDSILEKAIITPPQEEV